MKELVLNWEEAKQKGLIGISSDREIRIALEDILKSSERRDEIDKALIRLEEIKKELKYRRRLSMASLGGAKRRLQYRGFIFVDEIDLK